MNLLSSQTKKFRSDLSSLKSKIYGLHSESHTKAPDFEDLSIPEELMAEFKETYKTKKYKKTTFEKEPEEPYEKETGSSHYKALKDQFDYIMKN